VLGWMPVHSACQGRRQAGSNPHRLKIKLFSGKYQRERKSLDSRSRLELVECCQIVVCALLSRSAVMNKADCARRGAATNLDEAFSRLDTFASAGKP
jgi:hypothetical protein